jgi:hypothetical protein
MRHRDRDDDSNRPRGRPTTSNGPIIIAAILVGGLLLLAAVAGVGWLLWSSAVG